jgi:plastocyanin
MKRAVLALPIILLLLSACSSSDEASPSGAELNVSAPPTTEVEVTVKDRAFNPDEITITEGTTVTWINEDETGHTVTNGEGGAPALDPLFDEPLSVGQTVTYTFDEPGTFPVTCRVHHGMQMTVIVEESGS